MPRHLSIDTPDGLILAFPVPRGYFRSKFLPMLVALQDRWTKMPPNELPEEGRQPKTTAELMLEDPWCIGVIKAIVSLIPTFPENALTIDLLQQNPDIFRSLFIGIGMDNPDLVLLHDFKPIDRGYKPFDEREPTEKNITIKDIPMPTSGDPDLDILADLIGGMESVSGAFTLLNTLDSESLDKLFYRLEARDERIRDPDAIVQKYLKERLDAWIADNRATFEKALYGE